MELTSVYTLAFIKVQLIPFSVKECPQELVVEELLNVRVSDEDECGVCAA